jgi:osmotically-inducible protein OsmY
MAMTIELSSDERVQRDVLDELHWDPEIDPTEFGVEVNDGVVTLIGKVDTYRERRAAEEAAMRVYGVKGVVNELRPATFPDRWTDSGIAHSVSQALEWNTSAPHDRVKVRVANGWVTLEGTVDHFYQARAAENVIADLMGVRGVTNRVVVDPRDHEAISAAKLRNDIERAFVRNAEIDARRITISVKDSTVSLTGNVRSWAEHEQAKRTTWSSKGVREVDDKLLVVP